MFEITTSITVKDTANSIVKLNVNETLIDATALMLPFIDIYNGGKTKEERVKNPRPRELLIQSKKKDGTEISLTVTSSYLGVPDLYDKNVFMALQTIYLKRMKKAFGEIKFKKDLKEISVDDLTTEEIDLYDIAKEMNYKDSVGINVLANICDSIRRLNDTTWRYGKVKHAHIDKLGVSSKITEKGFKLIDEYDVEVDMLSEYNYEEDRFSEDTESSIMYRANKDRVFAKGKVKIRFSPIVYTAIANNQILYYEPSKVYSIKTDLARYIYLYSKKRAGKPKVYTCKLEELYGVAPILETPKQKENGDYEKRKKAKVKTALDNIKKSGECTVSLLKGEVVRFDFNKRSKKLVSYGPADTSYMKDKYKTYKEFKDQLVEIGLDLYEIANLDLENIETLKAQLRLTMIMCHYDTNKVPKDVFVNMVNTLYMPDTKYYGSIEN